MKVSLIFSRPFLGLVLTLFLSEAASTMITPLMPFLFFSDFSSFFDASVSHATRAIQYGYATAAIRVGAFLASVLLGLAMDRWGRRWVLLLSCFGLACSMATLAFSIDRGAFILFITGLFFCNLLYAGKQTAQAIVGDEKSSSLKLFRMSLLQSGIALGACLGPVIAGAISHGRENFSTAFYLATALALVSGFVVLFEIKETLCLGDCSPVLVRKFGFFGAFFREKRVKILLLQLFLSQLSWGMYYEFSPLVAKLSFDFSPSTVGLFVGMIAFWLIVGSGLILPFLTTILSTSSLKFLSVVLMLGGILLSVFSRDSFWFWVSAVFVSIGDVMIYALIVNEVSDQMASNYQGRMTALIYVVITLTWSFTGVLGGYLTAYATKGALWFSILGVFILTGYFLCRAMRSLCRRV
jgi:DHA1 family tetracycline resistance protein-like MFS transporter